MLYLNQLLNQPLYNFETRYDMNNNLSVTDSHFRSIPENILEWENFSSELLEFREKRKFNDKLQYENLPIPHKKKYVFNDEPDVVSTLTQSLFEIIIDIFDKTSCKIKITSGEEYGTKNIIAEPDRVSWENNNNTHKKILLIPIEIKKPFINDNKLRQNYPTDKKSQKIIQQAVGYMYRNLLKYSIITTYNHTYALHLNNDGVLLIKFVRLRI